jgi:hypothetical protein
LKEKFYHNLTLKSLEDQVTLKLVQNFKINKDKIEVVTVIKKFENQIVPRDIFVGSENKLKELDTIL